MTTMLGARSLALSLACALAACGGGSKTPPPSTDSSESGQTGEDAAAQVTCEGQANLDTYVANLTKTGTKGLSFVLVSGDPAPPARGTNTWTLHVNDASGKGVDGAQLDVKPFMPQHGHGSSVEPTVTATGSGAYTIGNLYLFMPGLWTITITATTPSVTDAAVFTFCIAG
jgi:hypothetical protein